MLTHRWLPGNGLRVKTQRAKNFRTLLRRKQSPAKIWKISRNSWKSSVSDIFYLLRNLLKFLLRTVLPRSFQKFSPSGFNPLVLSGLRQYGHPFRGVPTTPEPNTSAKNRDTNGRRIVMIEIGVVWALCRNPQLSELQTYPNLHPLPRVGPPLGCLPQGCANLCWLVPVRGSQKRA